ncbi:SubName: Full=Uncharacterized protein {ECO:0000313/EMBL:CCA68227.1} [Serendipita indica DSM 11827]|nr:SubName: Full=Uncharacterized protein {ECO:0000313/EMBL:CCA68227.1} [Serendipita indica DSM 11827]
MGAYDLQGGVYVQGRECGEDSFRTSKVDVHQLPSLLYPGASWSLPNFAIPINDFTLNPYDDLLVTVEETSHGSPDDRSIMLRFLSLTDGSPHCQSCKSVLIQSGSRGQAINNGFFITAMGDFVGLLTLRWHFLIVNWKTGKFYAFFEYDARDPVYSFFFLDDTHFVLARGQRTPPELEIYQFSPSGGNGTQPALIAVYHLPRMAGSLYNIVCRSDPPPFCSRNDPESKVQTRFRRLPFHPHLEDRAIVVRLTVIEDGLPIGYTLVFRASSLFNTHDGAKIEERGLDRQEIPVVEGKCWMQETFLSRGGMTSNYECFIYGSRFLLLHSTELDDKGKLHNPGTRSLDNVVTIANVNPAMVAWVRAQLASREQPHEWSQYRIIESKPVKTYPDIDGGWIGGLPIALTSLPHLTQADSSRVVAMIDGERLLMLRTQGDIWSEDALCTIDIYTHNLSCIS